jgi:hypothetical protein
VPKTGRRERFGIDRHLRTVILPEHRRVELDFLAIAGAYALLIPCSC